MQVLKSFELLTHNELVDVTEHRGRQTEVWNSQQSDLAFIVLDIEQHFLRQDSYPITTGMSQSLSS